MGIIVPVEGGVSSGPKAVEYLLRSYAKSTNINTSIQDLRKSEQKPDEEEQMYASDLCDAVARCGNVFPLDEVITVYMDVLHPSISSLFERFLQAIHKLNFLEALYQLKSNRYALRSRTSGGLRIGLTPRPVLLRRLPVQGSVNLAQSSTDSATAPYVPHVQSGRADVTCA